MATIKIKFRFSSVDRKEGTLYYQIIHKRVARQICTGCKVYSWEWNSLTSQVIILPGTHGQRQHTLQDLEHRLIDGIARLKGIVKRFERTGKKYTVDDVVDTYFSSPEEGFLSFCRNLIRQLRQVGKIRTAETYSVALNSFVRFRGDDGELPLDAVNSHLMVAYESYLKSRGVCPNSSSYYMRNLRAMYNRAVDKDLVEQWNPFKHVYTGIDKTVKRAVPVKVIRQIRDMDLTTDSVMELARDLFMFSFYTRGMSFIDMAYLKKKDLQNGILSYRRQKTGQRLYIKWEKLMQEIVDKHGSTDTPYLLPIIKSTDKDARLQYLNALHLMNSKLKVIGKKLGLDIPLTTYVARHGWASIARSRNIPISIISEAMGHESESTTRIYLASLDTSVVDKANSVVLKSI